ncbi:hypothetical protein EV426DRAFT_612611 [Tirmania nivea]|nr:hypothetical protein EV426DRAFT_612611 [Tirmania nivea]
MHLRWGCLYNYRLDPFLLNIQMSNIREDVHVLLALWPHVPFSGSIFLMSVRDRQDFSVRDEGDIFHVMLQFIESIGYFFVSHYVLN